MRFRKALPIDVFEIIKLYQQCNTSEHQDKLFLNYRLLEKNLTNPYNHWLINEIDGAPQAAIGMNVDEKQRICKINRMMVNPELDYAHEVLRETVKYALHFLENELKIVDLVYTTTLSMSLQQQQVTLEEGFKILGIFPNALGEDSTNMNGLTAYYFNNVLEESRYKNFKLHPSIAPFFQISRDQYQIEDLEICERPDEEAELATLIAQESLIEDYNLEMIRAQNFVSHRFSKLMSSKSQVVDFYPFYTPNCMIVDPEERIEIFLNFNPDLKFCAIIGEHTLINVNPIHLYAKVLTILKDAGISYIEIINDASDLYGVDCILQAGFTPCAYFPAFKRQGSTRRDYVVFGKSFEYLCKPQLNFKGAYSDFYREYFKIEGKNYFPDSLVNQMGKHFPIGQSSIKPSETFLQ